MARLSLWKDGRHSNDYRFIDRRISEMFTISGTGVNVHKYLGPLAQTDSTDATQPANVTQSELNIQDLLLLENRDRRYDTSVYTMRGIYTVADTGFDLSQFGLFLQTGTLFMTFHITDMIDTLGRRIMNGDVLELQHLIDYDTLDSSLPVALKRYFVVSDCSRSAEGYSPTWWPHLWRCKINPLVDSQEYKDILDNIRTVDGGLTPIGDILSTYDRYANINDAIITQAESDVPKSGYDTSMIYTLSADDNTPEAAVQGYLVGDGLAPNGLAATSGTSFPASPQVGDYCLRLDFSPDRLFRYDGRRWIRIEDNVRTNITNNVATNKTLRNQFVTNNGTWTDVRGNEQPSRQNLNEVLKPKPDN